MKKLYLIAVLTSLASSIQAPRFWPFSSKKSYDEKRFDKLQKTKTSDLKLHKDLLKWGSAAKKERNLPKAQGAKKAAINHLRIAVNTAELQREQAINLAAQALDEAERTPTKDNAKRARNVIARSIKWEEQLLKPHRDELKRLAKKIEKRKDPAEQAAKHAKLFPLIAQHNRIALTHEGTRNILDSYKRRMPIPRVPVRGARIHDATPTLDTVVQADHARDRTSSLPLAGAGFAQIPRSVASSESRGTMRSRPIDRAQSVSTISSLESLD